MSALSPRDGPHQPSNMSDSSCITVATDTPATPVRRSARLGRLSGSGSSSSSRLTATTEAPEDLSLSSPLLSPLQRSSLRILNNEEPVSANDFLRCSAIPSQLPNSGAQCPLCEKKFANGRKLKFSMSLQWRICAKCWGLYGSQQNFKTRGSQAPLSDRAIARRIDARVLLEHKRLMISRGQESEELQLYLAGRANIEANENETEDDDSESSDDDSDVVMDDDSHIPGDDGSANESIGPSSGVPENNTMGPNMDVVPDMFPNCQAAEGLVLGFEHFYVSPPMPNLYQPGSYIPLPLQVFTWMPQANMPAFHGNAFMPEGDQEASHGNMPFPQGNFFMPQIPTSGPQNNNFSAQAYSSMPGNDYSLPQNNSFAPQAYNAMEQNNNTSMFQGNLLATQDNTSMISDNIQPFNENQGFAQTAQPQSFISNDMPNLGAGVWNTYTPSAPGAQGDFFPQAVTNSEALANQDEDYQRWVQENLVPLPDMAVVRYRQRLAEAMFLQAQARQEQSWQNMQPAENIPASNEVNMFEALVNPGDYMDIQEFEGIQEPDGVQKAEGVQTTDASQVSENAQNLQNLLDFQDLQHLMNAP